MFRRAGRRLWATPIFTIFAVASLALGVGVTTAIYAVVESITTAGLTVPSANSLAFIVGAEPFDGRRQTWRSVVSRPDLADLRAAATTLGDVAVSASFYQSVVTDAVAEVLPGEAVSGNYFTMLGIQPRLGRLLQPADDATPARLVVLGHQFWRTRLGEDSGVLGSVLRIGGEPFEIVGVAPEGFNGLNDRIQSFTGVFVPLSSTTMFPSGASPPADPSDRRRRQLSVIVAASPRAGFEAMAEEVRAIGARLDAEYPIDMRPSADAAPLRTPRNWSIRPLVDVADDTAVPMITTRAIVMGIVGLVLVVACTNLANLVLARASGRQHELAVRRALGASRARLIREELVETTMLAVLGAVGAFVVARVLIFWFGSASLPIASAMVVQLDPRFGASVVAVAALSLLGSLLVFGVWPAWQVTRGSLRPTLAAEGGTTGQLRWRTKRRLIAVQVAISLAFFLIATFAVRVTISDRSRPSGIDLDRLAVGMLNFRLPPWNETRAREVVERLLRLAPSQPGLESVSVSSGMPFGTTYGPFAEMTPAEQPFRPGALDHPQALLLTATPSIFPTLGLTIVRGRAFDERDVEGATPVAVVSEQLARQLFGSIEVVGRPILLRNALNMVDRTSIKTVTVAGVVSDTDVQHRFSRRTGVVYLPFAQHFEPTLSLVGRTSGDPAEIITAMKALAGRADPDLVLDRPATAAMSLAGAYVLVGVVSRVSGGLALLAMVLAMAGLFGVLSHLFAKRTREIGLRMALGADSASIRRLVLGDGLRPVLAGVVLGLIIGVIGRLLMRAAYDNPVTLADVAVFGAAPVPILLAAIAACYWPARRAGRVQPSVALKEE